MLDQNITTAFVILAFVAIVAAAAYSDFRTLRIPNRFSAALVLLYPVYLAVAPDAPDWTIAAMLAGVVLVVGFALFAVGYFGGGDVKLLVAVSLWAGPDLIIPFLFATGIVGGLFALFMTAPVRVSAAVATEQLGAARLSVILLGTEIPYGLAIFAGAVLVAYNLAGFQGS